MGFKRGVSAQAKTDCATLTGEDTCHDWQVDPNPVKGGDCEKMRTTSGESVFWGRGL